MNDEHRTLSRSIRNALKIYRTEVKRPASGSLLYDYLIPAGVYEEQFDWDAFFIGMALSTEMSSEAIYLRNTALNFILNAEADGFTAGAFGPRGRDIEINHIKPFLAQMVFFSSKFINNFEWILPYYTILRKIVLYRERYLWDKTRDLAVWFDACESGIDNNITVLDFPNGSVVGTDCNTYVYREYKAMSYIAMELGQRSEAANFESRAENLKKNINTYLWDEEDQSYYNIDSKTGKFIKHMAISNFIPLWENVASQEQADAMIQRYLVHPQEMWSPYGFRTLSKNDTGYNNVNMIKPYSNWRGPIWPLTNYLGMHILLNYGYQKEALEVADRTTKLLLNDIKKHGSMHENYDAETGEPLAAPHFVSWNLLVGNMLEDATQNRNPFAVRLEYENPEMLFSVLDTDTTVKASQAFAEEIKKKQQGKTSSLSALAYPMNLKPLKDAQGIAFVADGMVGKSAYWSLKKDTIEFTSEAMFTLPPASTKDEYFRLLTQKILESNVETVGFNIGYALEPKTRDGVIDGKLIRFAKEHYIKGLKGHFVGKDLEKYLSEIKHMNTNVSAANDIICLLLSGLTIQNNPPSIAGFVGDGMNFSFFDSPSQWIGNTDASTTTVAINLEAANFNKIPPTRAGRAIDRVSDYPGKALAEKETSGGYLFVLYNWIMKESRGPKAQLISNSFHLNDIAKQPDHVGYELARQLLERSAQITAIELGGILTYLQKTQGIVQVIMDGWLFWDGEGYKDNVIKWLKAILPDVSIEFIRIEKSDLTGAAVLASQI